MTDNLSCRANLTFLNFPLSRDVTIPLYSAAQRSAAYGEFVTSRDSDKLRLNLFIVVEQ